MPLGIVIYGKENPSADLDASDLDFPIKSLDMLRLTKYPVRFKNKTVTLSPQETRCLTHFSRGKSIKDVAAALELSPRAVEQYLASIRNKTNISDRAELAHYFLKNKISTWFE